MKVVEYTSSRLLFKSEVIEPLEDDDIFIVHTPNGSFRMSKADFYKEFQNVIKIKSYREMGWYSYVKTPKRAMRFLTEPSVYSDLKIVKPKPVKVDFVGDALREQMKKLGQMWHSSANNPDVSKDVLKHWNTLIDEWVKDKSVPLIVRKNTEMRGRSFIHPTGREIIISDNTFAIWAFSRVLENKVFTVAQIKDMLERNEIPMVYMQTKYIKENAKYSKPLGVNAINGWKLCHIEPVGFNSHKSIEDLDIHAIERHFRKYANPNNMFVLPKEIGGLGEIKEFIEEQKRKTE